MLTSYSETKGNTLPVAKESNPRGAGFAKVCLTTGTLGHGLWSRRPPSVLVRSMWSEAFFETGVTESDIMWNWVRQKRYLE